MKLNITQSAINQCAAKYGELGHAAKLASGPAHESAIAAQVAFVDCFALLTDQPWINAQVMLAKRDNALRD